MSAREKAPGGLKKVLFIRIDETLAEKLEEMRERCSVRRPGTVTTTSDLVRALLWDAVRD